MAIEIGTDATAIAAGLAAVAGAVARYGSQLVKIFARVDLRLEQIETNTSDTKLFLMQNPGRRRIIPITPTEEPKKDA